MIWPTLFESVVSQAFVRVQALKEILDNTLLLSKKLFNMVNFLKEQTFLIEYFESSFKFRMISIV